MPLKKPWPPNEGSCERVLTSVGRHAIGGIRVPSMSAMQVTTGSILHFWCDPFSMSCIEPIPL